MCCSQPRSDQVIQSQARTVHLCFLNFMRFLLAYSFHLFRSPVGSPVLECIESCPRFDVIYLKVVIIHLTFKLWGPFYLSLFLFVSLFFFSFVFFPKKPFLGKKKKNASGGTFTGILTWLLVGQTKQNLFQCS